ncbi:DcaP family trimeric outer membrane transporter [Shewanella abyssi]|uniref:DcaP family trimeric outer membrane transporter n=1 Tax=Shewanella abyssi TaxID=311789 RepID=UPI00200EE067|nr:DcaP family trimeric outer membrane transporter [Shewanella abyssi]MCL1049996.1 DcaP family trimeric outer membrane transporter [Shewanella abyssi]
MNNKLVPIALACFTAFSASAAAADIEVGGFIKGNIRYIGGEVPYNTMWIGSGAMQSESSDKTQISAQESRFNAKFTHNGVVGFAEIDFVGSSQGNGVISNSYSPRLRHAYIKYEDITFGQTWSTLINTSTFPESADLGGPLVGEAMIRQGLIRYQHGDWQFALENPNTYGTDEKGEKLSTSDDYIPDMIVRHDTKGDWGNISVSALVRYLDPENTDKISFGGSAAAKFHMIGKDDLRIQLHYGNLGRYVGTVAARDIYNGEVETTTAGTISYRHFWNDTMRSSIFYGRTVTEEEETDRYQIGVNLFTNLTPELKVGFEVGRYEVMDTITESNNAENGSSDYVQFTMQFSI